MMAMRSFWLWGNGILTASLLIVSSAGAATIRRAAQQCATDERKMDQTIVVTKKDAFSFRIRRSWLPGMDWNFKKKGWCVQCKLNCCEGDELVMVRCGGTNKHRQRFIYEEMSPGEGRFKPNTRPSLCVTKSASDDSATLRTCESGNPDQIFSGFQPGHAFELQAKSDPDLCLAAPDDENDDDTFTTVDCSEAREVDTTSWEAVYQHGEFNGYIPFVAPCHRTCLDVYQDNQAIFVGQFLPVATMQSVELFYQYNAQNRYEYNGDKMTPLDVDTSIIFVHQDALLCDLALVVVHGGKELKEHQECKPGGAILHITGNLEECVVQDGRNSPSDSFTYNSRTDETKCDWTWSWQNKCQVRTDGLAHRWDPKELECLRIRPEQFSGLKQWMFVPGQEESDTPAVFDQYAPLNMEKDLEICLGTCL